MVASDVDKGADEAAVMEELVVDVFDEGGAGVMEGMAPEDNHIEAGEVEDNRKKADSHNQAYGTGKYRLPQNGQW